MSSGGAGLATTLLGTALLLMASLTGRHADEDPADAGAQLDAGPRPDAGLGLDPDPVPHARASPDGNHHGRQHARWRVWLALSGLALVGIGLGLRYAATPLRVGMCAGAAGLPASAHCYHGAPWPPHGSSR